MQRVDSISLKSVMKTSEMLSKSISLTTPSKRPLTNPNEKEKKNGKRSGGALNKNINIVNIIIGQQRGSRIAIVSRIDSGNHIVKRIPVLQLQSSHNGHQAFYKATAWL